MKLIDPQNLGRGRRCTITNRTKDPVGFITTGVFVKEQNGHDQEVVLSVAIVRELGRVAGMELPEKIEPLRERIAELEAQVREWEPIILAAKAVEQANADLQKVTA